MPKRNIKTEIKVSFIIPSIGPNPGRELLRKAPPAVSIEIIINKTRNLFHTRKNVQETVVKSLFISDLLLSVKATPHN